MSLSKYLLVIVVLTIAGCATTEKPLILPPTKSVDYKAYVSDVEYALVKSAQGGRTCKKPKTNESVTNSDWLRIANSCLAEKNWKGLEEVASTMNQRDPQSPWAPYYLALVSETNGNYPKANWFMDQSIKRSSPKVGLFRYQKARLFFLNSQFENADREMQAAVEFEFNLLEGYVFLGELAMVDRDLKLARKYFEKVLTATPNHSRAIAGLSACDGLEGKKSGRGVASEQGGKK